MKLLTVLSLLIFSSSSFSWVPSLSFLTDKKEIEKDSIRSYVQSTMSCQVVSHDPLLQKCVKGKSICFLDQNEVKCKDR